MVEWLFGSRCAVVVLAMAFIVPIEASAQTRSAPVLATQLTPFARDKAETLVRERLPCLGCHTLDAKGGKLAPELATVRSRREAAYVARVVADPQGTVPGTIMPRTPMPSEWRALIVRYLGGDATMLAATSAPPKAALGLADTVGATLYARFCTGCHGPNGRGDGPNASSLPVPPARHASSEAMSARSDDDLYDTIAGGGAIMNRSARMPAYGETLSPVQIRALVRHIRSLCRCTGPSWSTDNRATPK
jgi:mono/diheme cytochrome c family protein